MSSKIWDIVWVSKFKTRLKSITLLIKKEDENCIGRAQVNESLTSFKKYFFFLTIHGKLSVRGEKVDIGKI